VGGQVLGLVDDQELRRLKILPFFSMVDRRKSLHRQILADLPEQRPELLATQIPSASEVEQMGVRRQPLGAFAPRRPAALAYAALWGEIKGRLGGGQAEG
jgi:cellulose biosynthesis protein BcsQ